ncbi:glycosyltransferase family 2 protein [Chryseobacterium sp. SC28]|uniref:glycosyltransferase family 2 protein n=1 Tax=Chryseobacterium sp. SC28 TaxID=2268028 RepID=UPI000F64EB4F|nr:glycosyltransferase family 2 protein [Chryseobacterium sp. SC28]RRQ45848.1 glycosyltransferase family 2 protein [Chryseobacterium sp. SC28]
MSVSLIVPIFNAEHYLPTFLTSVLSQSYKDFELILVNDGSTDNSAAICDKYAAEDPRIRVYHKKNEGVSATRNFGIGKAANEFIAFADADDVLLDHYLSDLISAANGKVDMVVSAVEQIRNNDTGKTTVRSYDGLIMKNDLQTLTEKLQIANFGYVYSILYRKSIIAKNNLKFDTRLAQSEDLLFVLDYIRHLDKDIACIPSANYLYIIDVPNSGSKRKASSGSITLQLSLLYEMIAKKYGITDFTAFPLLGQLLDYLYYKKLSELVSTEQTDTDTIRSLRNLDKDMIRFYQRIKKKSLRASLLDFLLLRSHYQLFLKLRNF